MVPNVKGLCLRVFYLFLLLNGKQQFPLFLDIADDHMLIIEPESCHFILFSMKLKGVYCSHAREIGRLLLFPIVRIRSERGDAI